MKTHTDLTQQGNNRILLVNPPYYRLYKETSHGNQYPLSLGYMAGYLKEKSDWDVMAYNADFTTSSDMATTRYLTGEGFHNFQKNLTNPHWKVWEEVRSTIKDCNPAVLAIYCCAPNSGSATMIARLAKEVNSDILVLIGGPHPTGVGSQALDDQIDIVVRGEGENTLVDLLQAIHNKASLHTVAGIVYRRGREAIETPDRALIEDLDSIPFPYTHACEVLKDYQKHPKAAFGNVIATRGCPYNCFFCGSRIMWGRRVRFRSVTNVTEEVRSLIDAGLGWIQFLDDTFTLNREYVWELCTSLIQNCPEIRWACETRIDRLDEELLVHMKRAGCQEIAIGIESGNNEILKHMRKEITIEEAIQKVDLIQKHGIRTRANFLLGTPWETERTMHDTLAAMRRVRGRFGYSIFTPYPGTESYEYCKIHGLIPNDYNVALHNHQSPENHFMMNMDRKKFRELAAEIEEYVDKRDRRALLKDTFSTKTIHRILNPHDANSPALLARAIVSRAKRLILG